MFCSYNKVFQYKNVHVRVFDIIVLNYQQEYTERQKKESLQYDTKLFINVQRRRVR